MSDVLASVTDWFSRNASALGGLAVGAFAGLIFILLGGVFYSGEGFGTTSEPPEQVYFF